MPGKESGNSGKKIMTDGGVPMDDEEAPLEADEELERVNLPESVEESVENAQATDDEYSDWKEFEQGDEQFIDVGDRVIAEKDGEQVEGEVRQLGDNDLFGVETTNEENVTIESWDIDSYQTQVDDLEETRQQLREHFEGVGNHSDALQEYTDDKRYREIQDHLRSAAEVAEESPMYDHNPEMETSSAILATTDEDSAETIERLQQQTTKSLPEEMTVYRGIDVDDEDFLDDAEAAMENGDRLRDEGFQSTSIDEEVADGFGNVTLNIQTDHGVYVRAASEHAGEDEILLPAGTEFEVEGVDRESNTVDVVAKGEYDFNVDVGFIRETMEEENLSYAEAVEEVV